MLVADEPTAALDAQVRDDVLDVIFVARCRDGHERFSG